LRNLLAFLGFYPSETLTHSVTSSCTIITNPQQFINRFAAITTNADMQIQHLISLEFGSLFKIRDETLIVIPTLSTAWAKSRRSLKEAHYWIIIKGLSIASNGIIPGYLLGSLMKWLIILV